MWRMSWSGVLPLIRFGGLLVSVPGGARYYSCFSHDVSCFPTLHHSHIREQLGEQILAWQGPTGLWPMLLLVPGTNRAFRNFVNSRGFANFVFTLSRCTTLVHLLRA